MPPHADWSSEDLPDRESDEWTPVLQVRNGTWKFHSTHRYPAFFFVDFLRWLFFVLCLFFSGCCFLFVFVFCSALCCIISHPRYVRISPMDAHWCIIEMRPSSHLWMCVMCALVCICVCATQRGTATFLPIDKRLIRRAHRTQRQVQLPTHRRRLHGCRGSDCAAVPSYSVCVFVVDGWVTPVVRGRDRIPF